VDAISWVLGEQSHKSLRAGRMSDCIFNGTVKRPPMGMAEVTITMEDPELAEAARFVIEGAAKSEENGINREISETTENPELAASSNETILSLTETPMEEGVPEVSAMLADETQEVSEEPAFLKSKKKKKQKSRSW